MEAGSETRICAEKMTQRSFSRGVENETGREADTKSNE